MNPFYSCLLAILVSLSLWVGFIYLFNFLYDLVY